MESVCLISGSRSVGDIMRTGSNVEPCRRSKEIIEDLKSMLVGSKTGDQARDGTARVFCDHVKAQSGGDVMRRQLGSAG